jgi:hypothetical protein
MALFNFFLQLNAYSDQKGSNSPNLSNIRWARGINGLAAANPQSQVFTVAASATVAIVSSAKKFIYIESDKDINISINGGAAISLKAFVINNTTQPGQFVFSGTITSVSIVNPSSTDTPQVFVATFE